MMSAFIRICFQERHFLFVSICCAVSVFFQGCGLQKEAAILSDASAPPNLVQVSVVSVQTVENAKVTKTVFGKIIPKQQAELRFMRGGRVDSVDKSPGDRVAKGEIIASLEQADAVSQQQELQSLLEQAEQSILVANEATAPKIQQRIAQVKAQLQGVENAITQGQIVAPFSGFISSVTVEVNQNVSSSMPAVVLVEDAQPLIEVRLAESFSSLIQEEQEIWTPMENRSNLLKVVSREPIRGPTAGELITIEFKEDIPSDLREYGEVVEVSFVQKTAQRGCWLPLSVLQQTDEKQWSVYVAKPVPDEGADFVLERRAVNVLQLQNGKAFIDDSIKTSELVIREGTHRVVVGQHIQLQTFQGAVQ